MAKGLGKGLEAIIPGWHDTSIKQNIHEQNVTEIKIDKIITGRYQPRKTFKEEAILELAESIKEKGIIQPLVVVKEENSYLLIAGERRLRAAKIAGLSKVPVVIKNYTEDERLEIALIENLQREDLNAIEEAQTYSLLMEKYNLTQEVLSKQLSKSRSYIANMLRLLTLSGNIKMLVSEGKISSAKARTLLSISDEIWREEVAELAASKDLSVKEIENLAKKNNAHKINIENVELDNYIKALKCKFKEKFTNSKIALNLRESDNNVKGDIKIKFDSAADLNEILEILGV